MPDETRAPDALIFLSSWQAPLNAETRHHAIQDLAEKLLPTDMDNLDAPLYIRMQHSGMAFVSRSEHDTMLFPATHKLAYQPRYRWGAPVDSIQYGYLLEGTS